MYRGSIEVMQRGIEEHRGVKGCRGAWREHIEGVKGCRGSWREHGGSMKGMQRGTEGHREASASDAISLENMDR